MRHFKEPIFLGNGIEDALQDIDFLKTRLNDALNYLQQPPPSNSDEEVQKNLGLNRPGEQLLHDCIHDIATALGVKIKIYEPRSKPLLEEHIRMPMDHITALLQGKQVSYILSWSDVLLIIDGPMRGMFLTHEEIAQIQDAAKMSILSVLDKLKENKNDSSETDS